MDPECPYCGLLADLVDSKAVYKKSYGKLWLCQPCQAWVGTHKDGKNRPLGTLANAETRHARSMAHVAFDPIWQAIPRKGRSKNKVRGEVYVWLAKELGIDPAQCHIAFFDLKTCVRVIEICAKRRRAEAANV